MFAPRSTTWTLTQVFRATQLVGKWLIQSRMLKILGANGAEDYTEVIVGLRVSDQSRNEIHSTCGLGMTADPTASG